jgi:hypothetical protein
MIPKLRAQFNANFKQEVYEAYINELQNVYPGALTFRVAETPEFIPKDFTAKLMDCCEHIIDCIVDPNFLQLTHNAIPAHIKVPNENQYSDFIALDFGVCVGTNGTLEPKLIEMQGFPTLFGYQTLHDDTTRKYFDIPEDFSCYLNGYNKESYCQLLKDIILNGEDPKHVILLEILPHEQKTKVDFYCTEAITGISIVCITELIKEGGNLFYLLNGEKTQVKRIYNRVIFDDLDQQTEAIQQSGKILFEPLNVTWAPHPNWFYRISKYTMPFIKHAYIPKTSFLNTLTQIPADLENYVLKPLFSFAGQGVVIDVTPEDIANVKDPENWILQQKVTYATAIETPDEPAKFEIRIFYFWPPNASRPIAVNNLTRLSKGKMVGVRYNADKLWVGGSLAYFEK